jgi:hypothetical protein
MLRKLAMAAVMAAALIACTDGGFQRGVFFGKVIDKTPEEVISTFGKPDSIDDSVPDNPRYIYTRKTFNPDNMNKVDDRTIVDFAKKDGKLTCTEVTYM